VKTGTEGSRAWIVVLAVAAIYAGSCALLLSRRQWDVSRFVVAGGPEVDASHVPPGLTVVENVYDGAAFYRLSIDPVTTEKTAFGIPLDNPPYRQQRIVYPLLVHFLSFGHVEWIPALLVAVNFIAVLVMTFGAIRLARVFAIADWWGAMPALYAGFLIAFSRDTAEIVAWAFGVWAIVSVSRSAWTSATILFVCAALARESTLILAVGILAESVVDRVTNRPRRIPWYVAVAPLCVYIAWQYSLAVRWHQSGIGSSLFQPEIPFAQYVQVFREALSRRTVQLRLHFAECVFLAIVAGAVLTSFRKSSAPLRWRLSWAGYAALASVLGNTVWGEHFGFMRVLSDLYVTSTVVLYGASPRLRSLVAALSSVLFAYLLVHID
jgi:hypothetical protein